MVQRRRKWKSLKTVSANGIALVLPTIHAWLSNFYFNFSNCDFSKPLSKWFDTKFHWMECSVKALLKLQFALQTNDLLKYWLNFTKIYLNVINCKTLTYLPTFTNSHIELCTILKQCNLWSVIHWNTILHVFFYQGCIRKARTYGYSEFHPTRQCRQLIKKSQILSAQSYKQY